MARKRIKARPRRTPPKTNVDRVPKTSAVERWVFQRGQPVKRECARINAKMGSYRVRPIMLVRTTGDNWKVWDGPTFPTKTAALDSRRQDTGKKGFIRAYDNTIKEITLKVNGDGTRIWVDEEGQKVYTPDEKIKTTRKAATRDCISHLRKKIKEDQRHITSVEKQIAKLQARA